MSELGGGSVRIAERWHNKLNSQILDAHCDERHTAPTSCHSISLGAEYITHLSEDEAPDNDRVLQNKNKSRHDVKVDHEESSFEQIRTR